ncbi:MAG: S41 family peptidase, partial [Planctomycetota bacterium]
PRGRRAALLDQVMRLSRQLDRKLEKSEVLLEGTDPAKLVKIKETRIRELEAKVEELAKRRGGSTRTRHPVDDLFDEIMTLVESNYVDEGKTDRERLLLAAIDGMLRSLDEHTIFMDAKESKEFERSLDGNYPGIGAQVGKKKGEPLRILRPIYGGPAHRQGLRSGDEILAIDGHVTSELTMNDIMTDLKGPPRSRVKLKVRRRAWKQPRDVEIVRETIEVPSVYSTMLPSGIGYLRLRQFGIQSAKEFTRAVNDFQKEGLEGLVIDLRDNPGGRLPIAVKIVDLFVRSELPIVTQKGRPGDAAVPPYFPTDSARTGFPIVVLINENSASASEIVSGALQDYGRATVVGTRSFGKGSVQNIVSLGTRKGSQLKLTVQYYYLPNGRCVQTLRDANGKVTSEGGVIPDVAIETKTIDLETYDRRAGYREKEELLAYVDKHFGSLKKLVPVGDRDGKIPYPELPALSKAMELDKPTNDLRIAVRQEVQQRVEDDQGRLFTFHMQDDRQLQVALLELLRLSEKKQSAEAAYAWIPALTAAEKGDDKPEAPKKP